jgi:acetylornithine deacetylase
VVTSTDVETALARIDEARVVDLLCRLINTPSPTGSEAACAEDFARALTEAGIDAEVQHFHGERANVIAGYGDSDGVDLMFSGHLDTSGSGNPVEDRAGLGSVGLADRPKAYNMKGGLAAAAEALIALHEAGGLRRGRIRLTAVAGESEKAPLAGAIRSFEGPTYEGGGVGTHWLLTHAPRPDAVVICEPSDCWVVNAQPGYAFAKVTVRGRPLYQGSRARDLKERSSIEMAVRVVDALTRWEEAYRERFKLWCGLGTMYPNLTVGAIEGGWLFKPSIWPGVSNVYVDLRIPPHVLNREVFDELRNVVREAAAPDVATVHIYANGTPGAFTPLTHPLVQAALAARERVVGGPAEHPDIALNAGDDGRIFTLYGIPYVKCGPGATVNMVGEKPHGKEWVDIRQLVSAAQIYVRTALSLASTPRSDISGWPSVREVRSPEPLPL